MDRERLLSQQRVRELLQGRGDDRGADAVPHPPLRHGQRQRIHQPGPDRMATGARHRADPLPPLQEERPGHRRIQEQPHRAPSRVPLPVHGRRARPSQRAMGVGAHQGQPVHPVQEARRPGLHPRRRPRRVYDEPRTPWERLKEFDEKDRAAGGPGFILPGKREEIERIIATTNPAELVRRIHAIQDRLEALAAPRTAQLARRAGPDMAYLNKTLARIAGVEPEDDETRQADED